MNETNSHTKKLFVLDTNVLIHDPRALFKFADNDILIPMTVVGELDGLKKGMDEKGRNAREVTRLLDDLRQQGPLQKGVELPGGGTLLVGSLGHEAFPSHYDLDPGVADDRILALASHHYGNRLREVVLVTKDANVRIKADGLGLPAEDYRNDKVDLHDLYEEALEVFVPEQTIDDLYLTQFTAVPEGLRLAPNQCLTLLTDNGTNKSALVTYVHSEQALFLIDPKISAQGLMPRNREQAFALELLTDDNIKLVTLVGKAGTGKTLLALAAGLEGVEAGQYRRISVARPVVPLGRQEVGFLPGDEQEKLAPWMMPIYDSIEVLIDCGMSPGSKSMNRFGSKDKYNARAHPAEDLKMQGILEISGLYNIRGRSLPTTYLIIDEAQNLTPHEVKTIITRAGEGTKVVLTGDPDQIDNPYIDSCSNGLSYAAEKFRNEPIAGHLTLLKGERSELAEKASVIL
jgi:PhoH-like ATPase